MNYTFNTKSNVLMLCSEVLIKSALTCTFVCHLQASLMFGVIALLFPYNVTIVYK